MLICRVQENAILELNDKAQILSLTVDRNRWFQIRLFPSVQALDLRRFTYVNQADFAGN